MDRRALVTTLGLMLGAVAIAAGAEPVVVHEYFEYVREVGSRSADLPAPGSVDASDVGAFGPAGPDLPPSVEPMGPLTTSASLGLDRDTAPVPRATYDEVFTPSVFPWKRSVVLDAVEVAGGDVRLAVSDATVVPFALAPATARLRNVFEAQLRVSARAHDFVAIPSVAPDMEIHEATATPPAQVEFGRDAADNVFVRFDRTGSFRLTLSVSADAAYGRAPEWVDATSTAWTPSTELERWAAPALAAAGVEAGDAQQVVVSKLTNWTRAFEARPLAAWERHGSAFTDVVQARAGVCRHRAFAFVVAARGAGVRARFVSNEGHAFVEVHTGSAWHRVDLGGAADETETTGGAALAPSEEGPGGATGASTRASEGTPRAPSEAAPTPTGRTPHASASPTSPAVVTLALSRASVQRMSADVTASGVVERAGAALPGARVSIIAAAGGHAPIALARSTTDAEGRFAVTLDRVRALGPGTWSVHAHVLDAAGTVIGVSP